MRHQSKGRKFGLKRGPRRSFLRILVNNLIRHKKITTTEARAKEIRPLVERYISHAKKQNVASLRLLISKVPKDAAYILYHELGPKYKDRNGGYTRVTKLAKARKHDAAAMATIEFV